MPERSKTQPLCLNDEHEHTKRGDEPPSMVAFWGYWLCPLEDTVKVPPMRVGELVIPGHEAIVGTLNRRQRRDIEKFAGHRALTKRG